MVNLAEIFVAEDWGYRTAYEVADTLLTVVGKFIVDAGCGDGAFCRHLAASGARVLGIEPEPAQAERNNRAPVTANVGFKQAGAGAIPVEPQSVDGMIFSMSLHHMYAPDYPKVFDELLRVLKRDGFLYVLEPVASGTSQHVMELFHDETNARLAAYEALVKYADPNFGSMREIYFDLDTTYNSFDDFAKKYENKGFNNYAGDVRQVQVQERFHACENSHGSYTLTQPMRVNYYTQVNH